VSAPQNADIEIELKHDTPLVGGITGRPAGSLGGTTPSFGGN